MTDDPIFDYLRSRGRAQPPIDLVGSVVDAVKDAPRQRASKVPPFIPVAAALGAAAAVVAVAILLQQPPEVGPAPTQSAPPSSTTPPSTGLPSPSALSHPLAVRDGAIDVVATDASGEYGRIGIMRGADTSGYQRAPIDQDGAFFVELFMTYSLERLPEPAEWGRSNWSVRAEDPEGNLVSGAVLAPDLGPEAPRPVLVSWPGATEPELRNYEGWLIIQVPRDLSGASIYLDYTPTGSSVPAATHVVRVPGSPPPPVTLAPPSPTPLYVTQDGRELSVIESVEADELFSTVDTCTTSNGAYSVSYPESWYTNTAVGSVPACTWFSPVEFEVADSQVMPSEITITVTVIRGSIGWFYEPIYVLQESVMVSGFPGSRTEQAGGFDVDGPLDPSVRTYQYSVLVAGGNDVDDVWIAASSSTLMGGDYVLNKAVLDRIMASLQWTETVPDGQE